VLHGTHVTLANLQSGLPKQGLLQIDGSSCTLEFHDCCGFRRNDVAVQKKLCRETPTMIVQVTKFQDRDKDKDQDWMNGRNTEMIRNGQRNDARWMNDEMRE
jgi:hypothetical protein